MKPLLLFSSSTAVVISRRKYENISILFLFLLLFLFVPSVISAQSASEKSWKQFWTQFSAAVKNKNKAAVKRLMVSENNFSDGGGGSTRDEWLKMLDDNKLWGLVQRSVYKGVIPYKETNFNGKITKDRHLLFQYTGGKWRFFGVMGD